MLQLSRGDNVVGEPALPARATVPARGSVLVSRLLPRRPGARRDFELQHGSRARRSRARSRATSNTCCRCSRTALRIDQGFDGGFSHTDAQNRYAVDFARRDRHAGARRARRHGDAGRIGFRQGRPEPARSTAAARTSSASCTTTARWRCTPTCKTEGVLVRVGQRVRAGQQIGLSGNTGFTSGPAPALRGAGQSRACGWSRSRSACRAAARPATCRVGMRRAGGGAAL